MWGFIHGAVLGVERLSRRAVDNAMMMPTRAQMPRILATFAVVNLAWVFFRAVDLSSAMTILTRIVTLAPGDMVWSAVVLLALAVPVVLISDLFERQAQLLGDATPAGAGDPAAARGSAVPSAAGAGAADGVPPAGAVARWVLPRTSGPTTTAAAPWRVGGLVGLAVVALVVTSGGAPVPFIYFQF